MPDNSEALLHAVLPVTARQTFPPDKRAEIVLSKGSATKQLAAFNLCDGTKAQGEIARPSSWTPPTSVRP